MTQEVPSLFRDSAAPSVAVDTTPHPTRSADAAASDAAKEARLLSQLLLRFSIKRQHSAVAALFPHHIESSSDGHFAFVDASTTTTNSATSSAAVASHGLTSSAADVASASAVTLDAHIHPATDAALASSLLRTRPSERELVQQFLLLPQTSRNKVAQSLFVVPPSLLEDFAVILQFFLRVIVEAHSASPHHHYNFALEQSDEDDDDEEEDKAEDDGTAVPIYVPEKTCSWAKNGDVACVSYEPDEAAAATAAANGGALPVATTAVFTLPPDFHACLVHIYGSVHRSKCEEVWHGDHMAYRCRTCGLSDSSCMCLACFDPQDHEGHDYRVYRCSSGGCCDCGDPLAWKPDGFCKKHRQQALDDEPEATLGALEHAVIYGLVRRVVAFCMNALREVYTFCLRPGASSGAAASASFDAFFSQSQTVRALPRTGRRRSNFPTVMQVHLDRLQQCLAWLQALAVSCLPYRQIVTEVFLESLPPDFQLDGASSHPLFDTFPPRPLAILDVFLKAGVLLPVEMCDTLGVLYLKLLFDQPFKQQYTCHFVDWYPYFIELYLTASDENNDEGMRNLSRFIDRLFCQLFHSTAQLRELERASNERVEAFSREGSTAVASSSSVVERLLALLLEKLIGLFKNTLRVELVPARGSTSDSPTPLLESIQVVDCGRNVFKKRVYARLCSDIRTLLVHPLVAGEVLLRSFKKEDGQLRLRDSSVYGLLIQAYETLQQMDMQRRHVQQHIEFESQNWTFAFVVDYEMNLLLGAFLAGLPYCFQGHEDITTNRDPSWSNWEVARALVDPLRTALFRWSTRSGSGSWCASGSIGDNDDVDVADLDAISRFYQEPPRTNDQSPRSTKKSSFHLPLHHMFAAVFKGVGAFVELRSLEDWTRLLFDREESTESVGRHASQPDDVVFLYQVAEYPLRVATFAREIKAGLWVRNGNVMWQQLVHYYAKHWRFFGLHGDIFVSQLSALMLPQGSITRMLIQHQIPIIGPLLNRTNESSVRHESELLEEVLRLITQFVLSPLRYPTESSSLSLEQWATWLLEREMKHWLSLGPFSRSELVTHLDLKLIEQVRQMPRHEWFLLEEEEIVGHVLERVGVYDDPYGVSNSGSGDAVTIAPASGYGVKMSGTWRLKNNFWREISPLFECFSPSEAQLCEQNLKKHQLRTRVKIEDACVLPVPMADENPDYFRSARHVASQVLNSSSLLAVVHTVLTRWLDDNTGSAALPKRAVDTRCTSESLVVASMQSLSVAVRLLECESEASVDNQHSRLDDDGGIGSYHEVERQFDNSQRNGFFSQLCLEPDVAEYTASSGRSIVTSLLQLNASISLSPDTRALAQSVLDTVRKKSAICNGYVDAYKSRHSKLVVGQASDSIESSAGTDHSSADKQQLAKEMMRQRQQEILDRMRSQQQKFLSSHGVGQDGDQTSTITRGEDAAFKFVGEDHASDCSQSDEDEEACLSTEYEEEDEDEDDEWGFPAGHVDLELYFSHVASAVSQISDRERKSQQKSSRRLRRRTQSRVRTDSLGGSEAANSPSISGSSLEQDDEAEMEECALCRLPCESHSDKDSTFGYVAMVQPTALPTKLARTTASSQLPQLRTTVEISDRTGNVNATMLESACKGDAVVWTCGHAIHHSCIKGYIDSLWKQRANRNPLEALQHQGDDRLLSERDLEFLCPVCRRLSNCLLPDVTALLRPRPEGPGTSFSLLSASSFGEDSDSVEGDANFSDSSRHSFTKWLKGSMGSSVGSPFTSSSLSSRLLLDDGDVSNVARKRVRKFCSQLKLRSVRASLRLPLLLSGFADDELLVDAELRHVADAWGHQFSDWQLLLRCLEVELDVTLHERDLSGTIPAGTIPDRHRLQSLRLLVETSVATAMASGEKLVRGVSEIDNLESSVASTSEVLFGRRVLFAEDDEELGEPSATKSVESANAPLLSHPHLFEVFSKRLTALLAVSASRCAGTSEDYRYTEALLSDVFFAARVVVTAQILQALCSAVLTLPHPSPDTVSPPRSPAAHTPRSRKIIADFSDVETVSDAMQWAHLLLVRCRLVSASSVLALSHLTWDMSAVEKIVVDQALPLLRRIVLLVQASLPRVLDDGEASGDPCALCDELYRAGNAEVSRRGAETPRSDLHVLLRRLHLPPLRLFFRRVVFSPQQRELCQLWGAQMESKAAVLRRRRLQQEQEHEQLESDVTSQLEPPSLTTLLVPSAIPRGERRRLFIDLPKVYMDLFIKYNDKPLGQCQRCHQVPQHPAICLFCGDVVCCFSTCCESTQGGRIGECTQHAQSCGLGTGAFLLLRACTVILFLGNARRCVWGSLYVDKNGEEDPYLRRGRTLFLAPHRLLALETLLVSHGFAQNTAILANTSRRDGRRY